MPSLASLKAGETGIVRGFTHNGTSSQRLMHLGVIEGERIEVIRRAPAGDPIEIRILGYSLSLRTSEATTILVDTSEE